MLQMPSIELRFHDFGEQLHGLLTLHHNEIQAYVEAGVERALSRIGETIIEEAAKQATQKVHEDVKPTFRTSL